MAPACGQRERSTATAPAVPRQVHVGCRFRAACDDRHRGAADGGRRRLASTSTPRSRKHRGPAGSSKSSLWLTVLSTGLVEQRSVNRVRFIATLLTVGIPGNESVPTYANPSGTWSPCCDSATQPGVITDPMALNLTCRTATRAARRWQRSCSAESCGVGRIRCRRCSPVSSRCKSAELTARAPSTGSIASTESEPDSQGGCAREIGKW